MSVMDRTGQFSDAQAVTATAASTNVIDLGATGTPYGASAPLAREIGVDGAPLVVTVVESFNNLTSLTITMQVDDNPAFSSPVTTYVSPTYTLANLQAGAKYLLPDAFPVGTNERYVRLLYTPAGTAPTLGRITAGVVAARQKNSRY